jgi:hypothetical protein
MGGEPGYALLSNNKYNRLDEAWGWSGSYGFTWLGAITDSANEAELWYRVDLGAVARVSHIVIGRVSHAASVCGFSFCALFAHVRCA